VVVNILSHFVEKASSLLQEQILEHLLSILRDKCLNDLFEVTTKHGEHILRLSLEETIEEVVKQREVILWLCLRLLQTGHLSLFSLIWRFDSALFIIIFDVRGLFIFVIKVITQNLI